MIDRHYPVIRYFSSSPYALLVGMPTQVCTGFGPIQREDCGYSLIGDTSGTCPSRGLPAQ